MSSSSSPPVPLAATPDERASVTWARLESQIGWYNDAAKRNQIGYKATKVLSLVFGAAVPVAAATDAPRWLLGVLGGLVVVAEGVAQVFQFHRNWIRYRRTCEALLRERHLCSVGAGSYDGLAEPMKVLAERLETIVGRETGQWSTTELSGERKAEPEGDGDADAKP